MRRIGEPGAGSGLDENANEEFTYVTTVGRSFRVGSPARNPGLALRFRIAGGGLILLAVALIPLMSNLTDSWHLPAEIQSWITIIAATISLVAGTFLLQEAPNLTTRCASDVLADPRRPVLYLQSFREYVDTRTGTLGGLFGGRTQEMRLAGHVNAIGPFVTVGRPGEMHRGLGAARMCIPDEHWRAVVSDLIARAQLVILRVGATPERLWELQQVVQHDRPMQFLLFLPFDQEDGKGSSGGLHRFLERRSRGWHYQRFRAWATPHLPGPLPERIGDATLIYFDDGWNPHPLQPHPFGGPPCDTCPPVSTHPLRRLLVRVAEDDDFQPTRRPPLVLAREVLSSALIEVLILLVAVVLTLVIAKILLP